MIKMLKKNKHFHSYSFGDPKKVHYKFNKYIGVILSSTLSHLVRRNIHPLNHGNLKSTQAA